MCATKDRSRFQDRMVIWYDHMWWDPWLRCFMVLPAEDDVPTLPTIAVAQPELEESE